MSGKIGKSGKYKRTKYHNEINRASHIGQENNKGIQHPNHKLTEDDVRFIRNNIGIKYQKDLAKELGVTSSCISLIARGLQWKHLI